MLKPFFMTFFFLFSIVVFIVKRQLGSKAVGTTAEAPTAFKNFQRQYLIIFMMVWLADWLQGPYIYALYAYYDYSIDQIGLLFVVGFGVAGICGVFVGALADKMGRKKACIAYTITYALACVTKHFRNFWILMLGRVLGGTATALLYTVFESWMVSHHKANDFGDDLLGSTFTKSGQLNGIVAVVAGVLASTAADMYGPVAPFDLSFISLSISLFFITQLPENYGQTNANVYDTIKGGLRVLKNTPTVLFLGLSQSFFEGGMFIFIFMWTPALEEVKDKSEKIPFGYVFSCYMVACILGSTIFGFFTGRGHSAEWLALKNYVAAIVILCSSAIGNMYIRFIAFISFELCVGVFWPCAMTLRGRYIPEEVRATIMNFFRIPLNIIVVLVLLKVKYLPVHVVLKCCAFCMFVAAACQLVVIRTNKYKQTEAHLVSETLEFTKKSGDELTNQTGFGGSGSRCLSK